MSILARIQWHDRPADGIARYLSEVRASFATWATDGARNSLTDGEHVMTTADRHRTVRVRSPRGRAPGGDADLTGFEGIAWDAPIGAAGATETATGATGATSAAAGATTRWEVVVRAVGDDKRIDVVVENRMESSDPTRRVSIGRPRVVDDLLSIQGMPRLGSSRLLSSPEAIPAIGVPILVDEVLRSPGHLLPVIVCTQPNHDDEDAWLARAGMIAKRSRGFANVFTLDRAAARAFREHLGDLGAWNGCVRVYSPAPLDQDGDGWRHRYFLLNRFQPSWGPGIDRVIEAAAAISARLPTPPTLAVFSPASGNDGGDPASLDRVPVLESDLADALAQADALHEELEEREGEVNRLRGHLARLRSQLDEIGRSEIYWGAKDDPGTDVPDTVQDIEEAVLAAQTYLTDDLCLPDEARRDLDRLVAIPQATVWGDTTWRGLRALAAYARYCREGSFRGGFWEWCNAGFPESWPATDKKLSMTESETVRNTPRFNDRRLLPVAKAVNPTGRTHMYSHLKIAEGGKDLAPRVYFHDDTDGSTGKVHIGFIGPHYLMPNTKS